MGDEREYDMEQRTLAGLIPETATINDSACTVLCV